MTTGNVLPGVPVVAQWKRIWLVSMRTRVRSLASLSGLRIRHGRELWCGSQTQFRSCVAVAVALASSCISDLTLAWELPYAECLALKRQKRKRKEKRERKKERRKEGRKERNAPPLKDFDQNHSLSSSSRPTPIQVGKLLHFSSSHRACSCLRMKCIFYSACRKE